MFDFLIVVVATMAVVFVCSIDRPYQGKPLECVKWEKQSGTQLVPAASMGLSGMDGMVFSQPTETLVCKEYN